MAIFYLQVHRIIQSEEQRVCAKAVNSHPKKNVGRSNRAWILLKNVYGLVRMLVQVQSINIVPDVWRLWVTPARPFMYEHQAFAIG